MRQYFLVLLLLFTLFLTACASSPSSPTPVPQTTGRYDGNWSGSGLTPDGKTIEIAFTVSGDVVTALRYRYLGQAEAPCLNYYLLSEAARPSIHANTFSATPGSDFNILGSFSDPSTASGSLTINWVGRPVCSAQFSAQWTATRTQAATPPSTPRPAQKPLCGNNGCAELLLQLLVFGLTNGAVLALNAISVSVVYGAVRTLNLAHGDVFALTTALVTSIIIGLNLQPDWPPTALFGLLLLIFIAAVLFGALLSMVVERVAFRPFRGQSRLAPLIATLGVSFIIFQIAMIWRTHQRSWIPGEHRSVPGLPEVPTDGIPNLLPDLNLVKAAGLPLNITFRVNDLLILLIALTFTFGTYLFLRYTSTGRAIRACTQNPTLAQMIGINLNGTIARAFAFGGALAGVAAFVFALYYGRPFGQHGAQSGLFAFTAAMIGGIGNPFGALTSALILGVFSSLSDYFLSAEWTPVLLLALIIGLLFFRPTGFSADENPDDPSLATLRDAVTLPSAGESSRQNRWLLWMLVALAVFPLISALTGMGWQILVRGIGIFILLALGLNLLLGLAGVLDLGYAAAFGIGAYVTAIFTNSGGPFAVQFNRQPDFLLLFLGSGLVSGLYGLLKGALTHRLRSDYLAVATLAFGLLIPRLIVNLKWLTNGAAGISALPAPRIFTVSFANPTSGYYLVFVLAALVALASQRIITSRTGRAWRASSDDETAALASGVDVARYRLLGLVLSSAIAGMAGALYASTFAYVDPDILAFHWTAMLLTMVILGGAGSVPGVVLGTMLIISYDKIFIPKLSTLLALLWPKDFFIGSVPDLRGTSFFNFGIVLYLTVLLRARRKNIDQNTKATSNSHVARIGAWFQAIKNLRSPKN